MPTNENNHDVDILLSTYNGGHYLGELLNSLLKQTHKDWRLIVRDDGSSDNTVRIMKSFSAKHPERIILMEDDGGRLGPCQSFARLLEHSTANYIMFCDQDDVWFPEKVEKALNTMFSFETRNKGLPLLIHTDIKVADNDLNIISESFWRYQHIDPDIKGLNNLLVLGNVSGCTMLINSELRKLVLPIPEGAVLHDWWITLVASAFGRIEYVSAPTMLYRQHGRNATGAVGYSLSYFSSRARNLGASLDMARRIIEQGKAFLLIYGDRLSEVDREIVYHFSLISQQRRIKRLFTLIRFRLRTYGFLRSLGISMLFLLLSDKGSSKTPEGII